MRFREKGSGSAAKTDAKRHVVFNKCKQTPQCYFQTQSRRTVHTSWMDCEGFICKDSRCISSEWREQGRVNIMLIFLYQPWLMERPDMMLNHARHREKDWGNGQSFLRVRSDFSHKSLRYFLLFWIAFFFTLLENAETSITWLMSLQFSSAMLSPRLQISSRLKRTVCPLRPFFSPSRC